MIISFQQIINELAEKVVNTGSADVEIVTLGGAVTIGIDKHQINGFDNTLEAFNTVVGHVCESKRPQGVEFAFDITNKDDLNMVAIENDENPDCTIKLRLSMPRQ